MTDPDATPTTTPPPDTTGLERRATGLLVLLVALLAASALYLMYARGAFEPTQRLVLLADDSEGVTVGMDLTFSGFPIGRVRRIELAPDGAVRILVDVPKNDAHWLRSSSVFTLSRGLVGGTALRAFSGILTDPPLPDGAERRVLAGDASAEIPKLVAAVRDLVANVTALTAKDAALAGTLANVATLTGRLNEPRGALGVLMGNPADADKLITALNRTNALLAKLDGLTAKADTLVGHADAQVFGPQGIAQETQATVAQLRALLTDARGTLQGVDKLLAEAQGVAANARTATADLGPLRAEVEASLRKVQSLVNELNRRWPLARDTELKLP
ncbi:MlaD family protein [Ideonella sp. DXS22W]|uniref:MlaD family protein n=1 Tax=Pseudaquabacterium inlustre TaxID=2984192 RepID=A0ABU9CGC6_9BURK